MKVILAALILSNVAMAAGRDLSGPWTVTEKSCGAGASTQAEREMIRFDGAFLTHIYQLSNDQKSVCDQVMAYLSTTQSFTSINDSYVEEDILTPMVKRTQCTDLASGQVISNVTEEIKGASPQVVRLTFAPDNSGLLEWPGRAECSGEILKIKMKRP